MEYIERSVEELVRASDSTFKCVLVTGAWQTGKSTMFKAPFPDKKYVPTNDPFIEEQANENPNMLMMLNPSPAFYDEVQRAPGLFRFIKIACDASDGRGLFCLSGPQPLELMESSSESLSGRVGIIEMSGLSLREIQGCAFNEPFVPTMEYVRKRSSSAQAPENIWKIIHQSGYPALQDPDMNWTAFFPAT